MLLLAARQGAADLAVPCRPDLTILTKCPSSPSPHYAISIVVRGKRVLQDGFEIQEGPTVSSLRLLTCITISQSDGAEELAWRNVIMR